VLGYHQAETVKSCIEDGKMQARAYNQYAAGRSDLVNPIAHLLRYFSIEIDSTLRVPGDF
jgi:hypothetical protein